MMVRGKISWTCSLPLYHSSQRSWDSFTTFNLLFRRTHDKSQHAILWYSWASEKT